MRLFFFGEFWGRNWESCSFLLQVKGPFFAEMDSLEWMDDLSGVGSILT